MSGNTNKRQPIDGLINVCTLTPLHFYTPGAFFFVSLSEGPTAISQPNLFFV